MDHVHCPGRVLSTLCLKIHLFTVCFWPHIPCDEVKNMYQTPEVAIFPMGALKSGTSSSLSLKLRTLGTPLKIIFLDRKTTGDTFHPNTFDRKHLGRWGNPINKLLQEVTFSFITTTGGSLAYLRGFVTAGRNIFKRCQFSKWFHGRDEVSVARWQVSSWFCFPPPWQLTARGGTVAQAQFVFNTGRFTSTCKWAGDPPNEWKAN